MTDSFLHLSRAEQAEIIQAVAAKTGRSPVVLEKDVWVCWMLAALFSMPARKRIVFKGGTSLSKIFSAINRFSEDVDVTVDYRELAPGIDPFDATLGNTKRDAIREQLAGLLKNYTNNVIAPYLRETLPSQYSGDAPQINVDESGEKITIGIRSQFAGDGHYIKEGVLLEFGGRNVIEPSQQHHVQPYLADHVASLTFPTALVDVLSPERTFWEKATLVHAACKGHDPATKSVERLSRHWYDLSLLADHAIGISALSNRDLLADVIKTKKIVYRSAKAQYDDCVAGKMQLLPDGKLVDALRADYDEMVRSGMFEGTPPTFDLVADRLKNLERSVNSSA